MFVAYLNTAFISQKLVVNMNLSVLVALICLVTLFLRLFVKWAYSYWTRRGVTQLNPELFYGDLRDLLTAQISNGEALKDVYFAFKRQNVACGGIYWGFKPFFIPIDVDLIKDIMLKNFSHFQDRGLNYHKNDVLSQNLFRMGGEAWKNLRAKLTPTFTSSRMKMMFETVREKGALLERAVAQNVGENGTINVTDLSSRFTTDVIGSCAFGIECDSLADPECDFRVYGKKINQPRALKQWMENTFPSSILKYTGFKSFPGVENFFRQIVGDTIKHREENNISRKDFMHLLLELRAAGTLTDDEILGQCFVFFAAGFDTSSATLAFAMHELAKDPDVQDKVRGEILEVLSAHQGEVTYEGIKELVYMEQVIFETLRKYPVLPNIPRVCTKKYKVPNSKVVLEKGTRLQIPAWGIQMDPQFYPEPDKFDPDRFSKEEKAKRPDFAFLPFGEGPRVCIGVRFAILQSKVALIGLLKNYKYLPSPKTAARFSFKPSVVLLHATEDIVLKAERV